MGYSINQDMQEIYDNPDKWTNHGRETLINSCHHQTQDKSEKDVDKEFNVSYGGYCEECDISEDSAVPIMNYIYPLELKDFDEDKILKVVKETNCTILENTDSGEWFLSLCGGGMNLSQDIAYSFQILETWIPQDLLRNVCVQKCLSLGSKKYKQLAKGIIKQLKMEADKNKEKAKEWKQQLKELRADEKAKKEKAK